jgi:hypothetical protein
MSAVQAALALVFFALSLVCGAPKAPSAGDAPRPAPVQAAARPAADITPAKHAEPMARPSQCASVRAEQCPLRRAHSARLEL